MKSSVFTKLFSLGSLRRSLSPSRHKDVSKQDNLPVSTDLEIDWKKIIGIGNFSNVFVGTLRQTQGFISVKVPTPNLSYDLETVNKLMQQEITIMRKIGMHENVISLIAVITCQIETYATNPRDSICIITPLCMNGSLQRYLRSKPVNVQVISDTLDIDYSNKDAEEVDVTQVKARILYCELLKFSYQIASGMDFISRKNIIHGDLAARNILLDSHKNCKISDFGLSRLTCASGEGNCVESMKTENVKRWIPWRWMAIECLEGCHTTTRSDVWAFGVTLWEIFTIGDVPYPRAQWNEEFEEGLRETRFRLHKPKHANNKIYDEMKSCWNCDASKRPSFEQLRKTFNKYLSPVIENLASIQRAIEDEKEFPLLQEIVYQSASCVRNLSASTLKPISPTVDFSKVKFKYSCPIGISAGKSTFKDEFNGSQITITRYNNVSYTFVEDVKTMALIVDHPNVIKIIGKFIDRRTRHLHVVTEFVENGSLDQFLKLNSPDAIIRHSMYTSPCVNLQRVENVLHDKRGNEVNHLFCRFAFDIASGMDFLAHKKIIVCDLNTIRIFLDNQFRCKINLTSITRLGQNLVGGSHLYVKHISEPLFWRSLALESLKRLEFSTKSDVWSFGVTIWQIFTFGNEPFDEQPWGYDNGFIDNLTNGTRLRDLDNAPPALYPKLLECWDNTPQNRPSFSDLVRFFENLQNEEYYLQL